MMVMGGRGTDTRMYAPRSESDKMYSSANEDEDKYNPASPEFNEQRQDNKKRKEEEKKERHSKIKHIKIRATEGLDGEEAPMPLDDGNKRDDEREIGLQGGPAGSRGHLLDLATGAKSGTGSSMSPGLPISMSEPMDDAWSELLKGVFPLSASEMTGNTEEYEKYFNENILPQAEDEEHAKKLKLAFNNMQHFYLPDTYINNPDSDHKTRFTGEDEKRRGKYRNLGRAGYKYWSDANKKSKQLSTGRGEVHPREYMEQNDKAEEDEVKNLLDESNKAPYETRHYGPTFKQGKFLDKPLSRHLENQKPLTDIMQNNLIDASVRGRLSSNNVLADKEFERQFMDLPLIQSVTPKSPLQSELVYDELNNNPLFNASEPMEDAWSELLKEEPTPHPHDFEETDDEVQDYFDNEVRPYVMDPNTPRPHALMRHKNLKDKIKPFTEKGIQPDEKMLPFIEESNYRHVENDPKMQGSPASKSRFSEDFQDLRRSEPMDGAWSTLLKRDTPGIIEGRRRREKRQQFRPSTGQFKTPPGGMSGGVGATMRRFRARMRGIKGGKKTGLMKPHLSVEMSHRGIATKQPMSKDPQKYNAYRGQSEARKIQGNVRTSFSPRGRFGQRSFSAGPTGAGRLSGLLAGQRGQMSKPSLRPIRIRPPRPPRPPQMPSMMPPQMPSMQTSVPSMPPPPSSIMMSNERERSELIKSKNFVQRVELLNLMRRLIRAKEKEAMKKAGGGSAFEEGAVPNHPAGVSQWEDEEEKNDGPTQNLETNSSRLGLDPAGELSSKRGHMG